MTKKDFINWELTTHKFGYVDKKVGPKDKVIISCTGCGIAYEITYMAIRAKNGKPYQPLCRSCNHKRTWQSEEYRANQSAKQSAAMKKVWENEDYAANIATKVGNNTRERWLDDDFRNKVVNGVRRAHITKEGYTEKTVAAMAAHGDKRIAAIKAKYQSDAAYRMKISASTKKLWSDRAYRDKMMITMSSDDYKRKVSDSVIKKWADHEYATKILRNVKSKQETILSSLLDDLGIQHERQKMIGEYSFDFSIVHNNKTILVEVQGDYWHSKPRQIPRDAAKATYISKYFSSTHELKTIWEHDFLSQERLVNIVYGWFGLTNHELIDFQLQNVIFKIADNTAATILFSKYHYMASGGRKGLDVGAYLGDTLIACARYCNPTRDQSAERLGLKQSQLKELTRLVIHPAYQKKNLASKLLGKSISILKKEKQTTKCLLTFADTTFGHTGTIYKAANWQHDGTIDPDYFYVSSTGHVMHKKTMWDHAKKMSRSEAEHAHILGYTKKYGRTKERFIYWL